MKRNEEDRIGELALGIAPGAGPVPIREFLSCLMEEGVPLREFILLSPEKRRRMIPQASGLHFLMDSLSGAITSAKKLAQFFSSKNIGWFTSCDDIYPMRLLRFMGESAPFVFFYRGSLELLKKDSYLGIVGTREPSPSGIKAANAIAGEMAEKGIVIVSGGARGVDCAAHQGAMQKGATIFVLPYGIFQYGRLKIFQNDFHPDNHLILSEFHPEEPGNRSAPILRNRTVAALSDALVIVETGWRGGTLHTLRMAREYGKPFLVADYSPERNPNGNASLISTIGGDLPVYDKIKREGAIFKALKKGAVLLEKEPDRQTSLFP
ncbi:DNA-processing protein DprA [Candidatus Sumerlaeota bacterium]|nr:DNA-processing protein DprA [Candidatus Sumerlaeota bacterium]